MQLACLNVSRRIESSETSSEYRFKKKEEAIAAVLKSNIFDVSSDSGVPLSFSNKPLSVARLAIMEGTSFTRLMSKNHKDAYVFIYSKLKRIASKDRNKLVAHINFI